MALKYRGPERQFATGYRVVYGTRYNQTPATLYSSKGRLSTQNSPGPPYTAHNNFAVTWSEGVPGTFNGERSTLSGLYVGWRVTGGIVWSQTIDGSMTISSYPSISDKQLVLNSALSAVNFAKPAIYLPTFLWELKEFPRMLQDLGRVLKGEVYAFDVPGGHLAWQFGWAPLFNDLSILMNLGMSIEAEQRRFLQTKSRRKRAGKGRSSKTRWIESPSSGVPNLSIRREWESHQETWWTAHWDILDGYPDFLFGGIYDQYINALGLNKPLASIWNAMPWSWLVDYFTNFGQFLEASSGLAEYKPATICVMIRKTETIVREEASPTGYYPGWSYVPTAYTVTHKERSVHADPQARPVFEPFGFMSKLPILTSLVTAKTLRGLV